LASIAACQLIAGINDRSVYDGGLDGPFVGDGGNPACLGAGLPPNPGPNTSLPTDSVTFTAALSAIMLGQTDGGPYYGFNLDETCTCPSPDSCTRGPSQMRACDDPNGLDNYARRIFEQINALDSVDGGLITEAKLNAALQTGLSGALIKVTYYNGTPNDGEVTVTVYGSVGSSNYPTPPAFDGGDQWNIDPTSATNVYSTSNAYVANGTLVASLSFPIIIGSAVTQPVYIQLESGLIVATLESTGGVVTKMTGQLGGRWDPGKFLPSLQVVPDPAMSGSYLCGSDLTYLVLKGIICQNTDVNLDPANDGTGLCNAVSMGLGFEALPAQVGATKTPPDAGFPCGAGWTDMCQ
jgi:hypothetical protein